MESSTSAAADQTDKLRPTNKIIVMLSAAADKRSLSCCLPKPVMLLVEAYHKELSLRTNPGNIIVEC